jgi:ribosome-binding factor A
MKRRSTKPEQQGPRQRQLRVGEEIRHILARLLMRGELHDPSLAGVSVSGKDTDDVLRGLNRSAPHLRSLVAQEIQLRYAPTLTFIADKSFDEAHHIEELLRSERVRRDLKSGDGEA